ncbi:hypothetical protein P4576_02910 [Peribacillus frigoritolerans]|nr:hypothetical protein [Peribacillus frigoritolerans]
MGIVFRVTNAISKISEQTNLLSLNASLEAVSPAKVLLSWGMK